jgi:transglutaminase-like putative cysteine protease
MPSSASTETITYQVSHTTRYAYSEPVSVSHHLARVRPRVFAGQGCVHYELQIEPTPAVVRSHHDYFGNPVTFFMIERPHTELTVRAVSTVTVLARNPPPSKATPPWEEARDFDALPLEAIECLFDSASIAVSDAIAGYARPSFLPRRPLLYAVEDLMGRIHTDFTFDPEATTVTTPLRDVLALRRGVCQDFARLAIACLRAQGLPARYVSGYLETVPPTGAPRLAGVDASHAWLSMYCPGTGWIDVDPTNNMLPSTTHVTLAWGRDYADVSPVRGVILGGGQHTLHVSVDVLRA